MSDACDPKGLLSMVHPDLAAVVHIASAYSSFRVIAGLRSLEDEAKAVATHHSTTMHSRHLGLPQYDGKACAVDLAAIVENEINWDPRWYQPIAAEMLMAAHNRNLLIEWGGNWTFKDWGHFQLPWHSYP